jgi:hypothetical protein
MTDCTERSEGRKGMPGQHIVTTQATPVPVQVKRTISVNRLTVGRETR